MVSDPREVEGIPIAIIGAGLAGLEAAYHLWGLGRRCVVIEAGPLGSLRHINSSLTPREAMRTWLEAESADTAFRARWYSATPPHFSDYSGLRQIVGGRSLYWHGAVLPIESWALDDSWPVEVRLDLTAGRHGTPPLYETVLNDFKLWAGPRPNNAELVRFLNDLGYSAATAVPSAVRSEGRGAWTAYSALERICAGSSGMLVGQSELLPLLLANARVVGLESVASGISVQVVVEGVPVRFTAQQVVLAAGTIENARLVARHFSQGKAEGHLRFGIYDHLVQGFVVSMSASALPFKEDGNLETAMIIGDSENRSNLFVSAVRQGGNVLIDSWEMGEQLPSDVNWFDVLLEEPALSPRVHAGLSADDTKVINMQRCSLARLWERIQSVAGRPKSTLNFGKFGGVGNRYLDLYRDTGLVPEELTTPRTYYCPLGTVDHEGGSLPFGRAVDSNCRVLGLDRVIILGPSVFPRMGAANPSLTTIALARRTAAML